MLKLPNISEICVTNRLFKNRKMAKKELRVSAELSLDAKTAKTLISHHFSLLFKNHAYFTDIT